MIYREVVRGSQTERPQDFEINGRRVYARADIVPVDEPGEDGMPGFTGWEYSEAEFTREEYEAMTMMAYTPPFYTSAIRCAERRARYERMDPKVRSLERKIRLCNADGDTAGAEEAEAELLRIQRYCREVTDTQKQAGYPQKVEYPVEPGTEDDMKKIASRGGGR